MASFEIGARLRQERLSRGVTIDDVARETKISTRYLEAIEEDRFESLPGLVFARNFVRQFAASLKLDPDPLVADMPKPDDLTVPLPNPPARGHLSYTTDRRIHSAIWLFIAATAAIGAWAYFNRSERTHAANAAPAVIQTVEAAPVVFSPPPPPPTPAKPAE